jgi:hypothetical protein
MQEAQTGDMPPIAQRRIRAENIAGVQSAYDRLLPNFLDVTHLASIFSRASHRGSAGKSLLNQGFPFNDQQNRFLRSPANSFSGNILPISNLPSMFCEERWRLTSCKLRKENRLSRRPKKKPIQTANNAVEATRCSAIVN